MNKFDDYNKFLGYAKYKEVYHAKDKIKYPVGASLMISRKFFETIGLLSEEYLYILHLNMCIFKQKYGCKSNLQKGHLLEEIYNDFN